MSSVLRVDGSSALSTRLERLGIQGRGFSFRHFPGQFRGSFQRRPVLALESAPQGNHRMRHDEAFSHFDGRSFTRRKRTQWNSLGFEPFAEPILDFASGELSRLLQGQLDDTVYRAEVPNLFRPSSACNIENSHLSASLRRAAV